MSSQAIPSQNTASRPFTNLASMLLALLAIGHLLRFVFAVEIVIGGMIIPLGVSIPVAVFAAGLAYLVWRESH